MCALNVVRCKHHCGSGFWSLDASWHIPDHLHQKRYIFEGMGRTKDEGYLAESSSANTVLEIIGNQKRFFPMEPNPFLFSLDMGEIR